ncbi:MAG TPA: TrmB family transcriptional regulator [Oceanospirillales bacterium]|nr:TrmB family transcriptional regulator [Oceanospirillaceae bacterium]HBS41324.1 TrmB family transcriptional regulator [Oceanospirillales bacterium]
MILGELEKQVLNQLWTTGEADAKQIHAALGEAQGRSLNTIQSTLDRLYKKQLLSRSKLGHAFIYRPRLDRSELIARLIRDITSDFVRQGSDSLMAAFVSLSADLGDEELDRLEALIRQHRSQSQEPS